VALARKSRGYAERTRDCSKSGSNGTRNEDDWNESEDDWNESENDCVRKTRN
jgi:hypothetical protein